MFFSGSMNGGGPEEPEEEFKRAKTTVQFGAQSTGCSNRAKTPNAKVLFTAKWFNIAGGGFNQ